VGEAGRASGGARPWWGRKKAVYFSYPLVPSGTAQDELLQKAMRELLIETPEGYIVKGAKPGRLALISWRPVLFPE
jgi:hypothetical protein